MSSEAQRCAACGSELVDEPPGHCPTCTTSLALSDGTGALPSDSTTSEPEPAGAVGDGWLAGRYRLNRCLGRGGMGEVWHADDLELGQAVALKFLPEPLEQSAAQRRRLFAEVRIARRITHPNVCRVYDIGKTRSELLGESPRQFLSMEAIDGEDLASLLRRHGRLEPQRAADIGRQICLGLEAAHRQGILHRDLKPSNVMIDTAGNVRILDFGLAALASEIQGAAIRSGTPAYMAPEQRQGREVSAQSDLYSLGLVLYEIFTGGPPFPGRVRHGKGGGEPPAPPEPPSRRVEGLSRSIDRVILRCLAEDPGDRPSSALAVAAALAGAAGEPRGATLKTLLRWERPDSAGWRRLARRVAERYGGWETEGRVRVLVFDRPIHAVRWALEVRRELAAQAPSGPEVRVGIHLGEVVSAAASMLPADAMLPADTTPPAGTRLAAGEVTPAEAGLPADSIADPYEAEPRAATLLERLTRVAEPGQILLTRGAFDLARQGAFEEDGEVRWLAHGSYEIDGLDEPLEVFEVGVVGVAPLRPLRESSRVRRRIVQETISGWRPAPGLELPRRPGWALESRLGAGGFGEVWRAAHRTSGERRVFKFCYDRDRLRALQREITLFRVLKETLGDRDDITRICDWSFEESPYFIESEYTAGGSLVEWARDQGGLAQVPLAVRLELVAQLATALAAAHSVGVLHKDVKPSNVLITTDREGRPRVRLSDFGIGLLTERQRLEEAGITTTGNTEALAALLEEGSGGTRLYMAPELLEGKPATVQADVHALGVLLYQMVVADLTKALALGWERSLDDPLLVADIATAVDGSPERRFASAAQLAERLRRLDARREEHAAEQRAAVETRRLRESEARLRRRRRRQLGVSVVLALFVAVLAMMVVRVEHEAERANREAERAQTEAARANQEAVITREVSDFLVDVFQVSDPFRVEAGEVTARELLDEAARRMESELARSPRVRARLLSTIGEIYKHLGAYDDAERLLTAALERWPEAGDSELQRIEIMVLKADVLHEKGQYPAALALIDEAQALRHELADRGSPEIAEILALEGHVLFHTDRWDEAAASFRRALDRAGEAPNAAPGEAPNAAPGETATARASVASLSGLADLLLTRGELAEAERLYQQLLEMRRRLDGEKSGPVADVLESLALLRLRQERVSEAEALYRQALAMRRDAQGEAHPSLVLTLKNLALAAAAGGDLDQAEGLLRDSLELASQTVGEAHPFAAISFSHLAGLLERSGRYDEAERLLLHAYTVYRETHGEANPETRDLAAELAALRAESWRRR